MLADKEVDWITFASPFAVTCFFEQIPAGFVKSSSAKVASVGPVTSKRLAEFSVKIDVEASEHTIDGMLTDRVFLNDKYIEAVLRPFVDLMN
jgi:uroporphyrinogen-III synthase